MRTRFLTLAALGSLAACGDDAPPPSTTLPEILDVQATTPMVEGTPLRVTAANLDAAGGSLRLQVRTDSGASFALDPESPVGEGVVRFPLSGALTDSLGAGTYSVQLVLFGDRAESAPYPYTLTLTDALPIALTAPPTGRVHRNDEALLEGENFLRESEGEVTARFLGDFLPEGGASRPVDVRLAVRLADESSRRRGVVTLTTGIGGPEPGVFDGELILESRLHSGATTQSTPAPTSLTFLPPEVFEVTPSEVSLEQIVHVRGAGFLGGDDAVTLLRASGTLTPQGGSAMSVGPSELVLAFRSGSELYGPLSAVVRDDQLVSELFGIQRGRFDGTLTPIAIEGTVEVAGDPAPFRLVLGPLRQIVYLRFLPGFYASLARFGLQAATGTLEALVAERIEGIYDRWNIEVRLQEPTDFSPQGYTLVEIGGPDPNGRGLFGYDNTPGKDVGNLRLFDTIGGANAETQMDGFPGYGGVFVESFFGFSEHPPEDLTRTGGPDPDPLFDEIFDPVRARPATLAEVGGSGDRASDVDRAVRALASIIGETSAHELGHSLGLASPFGARTVFHNPGDQPGCLMDSGGSRPLGERAQEPGFAETRLCGDAPEYLDRILGP